VTDSNYIEDLRKTKSLLVATSLQKRQDKKALDLITAFNEPLNWQPLENLMIDIQAWEYIRNKGYKPKDVFCHPEILLAHPITSLYYRGLCGLSIKATKSYVGTIEPLEKGALRTRLKRDKALKMARTYNLFTCSIINNSTNWSLENGYRTIIATIGISLDGTMRNKVGDIAEERIRTLLVEWLIEHTLLVEPAALSSEQARQEIPRRCVLPRGLVMQFSSEPDIAFTLDSELLATVEIKGGIDPAGALERYGAAKKSFQHAVNTGSRCKNFYLGAVFTHELTERINNDRLVEKTFNVIDILNKPEVREDFFKELFHHTLRLVDNWPPPIFPVVENE
jgi:hypothetical protein